MGAAPEPVWRWVETDPWGLVIRCAEAVWAVKVRQHSELLAHEGAIRATLRDPHQVLDDPRSTAKLEPRSGVSGAVRHYVGVGRTTGLYAGCVVDIVVKVLRDPVTEHAIGYVQTAFLTRRLSPRLHLQWSR